MSENKISRGELMPVPKSCNTNYLNERNLTTSIRLKCE